MKDVVFKNGTLLVNSDVAPDQVKSVLVSRIRKEWTDEIIKALQSAQPETCEGCKHLGKWENEVEYGCLSPCTCCKRRVDDNYER